MTCLRVRVALALSLLLFSSAWLISDDAVAPKATSPVMGKVVGIGAVLRSDDPELGPIKDHAIVRQIVPKGPAQTGGLQVNDGIAEVDGHRLAGMSLIDAVTHLIRGEPNTPVKLTVVRPGTPKPFSIVLTRAPVDLPPEDKLPHPRPL